MHVRTPDHPISLQLLRGDHIENHAVGIHERLLHRASAKQIHSVARSRAVQTVSAQAADRKLALRVTERAERHRNQRQRLLNAQQR